jgi:DNA-binding NtrC family response regulator
MSKIKLLLVDDEEDYVRTMAERLDMRDVGSRVALSGEEALRMVKDDTPDVMVLDLRMPGINGLEVLERVKKEHPHVQVIILTGHGSEKEEKEARRLGAFEYLQKPADTSHILSTVRSAWQRGLAILKESRDEFERTMSAAALAEAGAPEMAREAMRKPAWPQPHIPAQPAPQPAGVSGQALKVLFVDDEEDFVRTVAERMEMRDLGGDVALGGQQALEMLEKDLPDVMVLDLRMPDIDGMEVLRRVKKTYPDIEVIIMTGHGSDQDEEEARRLGAFDYLRKPIDINQLMETVRKAGRARSKGE